MARANLIGNGSFEAPDVPSGSLLVSPTPTGWSSVGPGNNHLVDHPLPSAGNWPNAHDGDQYAALLGGTMSFLPPFGTIDMRPATGLRQTFTIPAAGEYELSWHDNAAIGVAGTPYEVVVASEVGSLLFPLFPGPLGTSTWSGHSFSISIGLGQLFTDPGTYSIEFRPKSIGVTLLDQVRLISKGSHSVPDSGGSLLLFGVALVGLGLCRRQSAA